MEGAFSILGVVAMPALIAFIVAYYRSRSRRLVLEERRAGDLKLLEAAGEGKQLLEARIQNLESLMCSLEVELSQRLNRVLVDQSIQRVPAPAPAAAGAVAAGPGFSGTATTTGRWAGPRRATTATLSSSASGSLPTAGGRPAASEETQRGYAYGQLIPGQVVLGRYTIERELGRGPMGGVYLARDAKLSDRVALKTISSVLATDPDELVQRLRIELQVARRVTHPNLIRIHDLAEDPPLLFISMEYVEGESLAARVQRLGQLPIAEARGLLVDVSAGVAAAHAAGIIHRDLKPQKVLVAGGAERSVKVIDLGLAKSATSSGMSATGLILGTPEYMAPEQLRGRRSDARADVYALGAIAYLVLTGKPPFTADTPIAVGFAQVHERPARPRDLRPEVPQKLEAVVMRALEKDPPSRYRDAGELKEALEAS